MLQIISDNLAPIMFASMILVLILGYSVAFSLAFVGFVFGFIGIELGLLPINLFGAIPDRIFGQMSNETLLAIPFFTFMGIILERSGMAEDLLDTIGQLFGPVRGGLAYAVIFVGAILAGPMGVVAASVIAMGLISLPIMLRYGYDRKLAAGVITSSGTLAQIIPPSLVLIILADQLGRSVGDMYWGAMLPSLILTALYALYVFGVTMIWPDAAPPLPKSARTLTVGQLWRKVLISMVPPIMLIFFVLGTIFIGLATPTEGAAMGAVGALALALAQRRLDMPMMRQALTMTAKLTSMVMLILLGARVFSLTFYGINGHVWVEHLLGDLPGGPIGFLIVVNVLVFLLAFFLDYFELAFIIIPLLAPVAESLGIDLIWFGVILSINMQTSFMHPPFGFALFYLRSVAPTRPYKDRLTGETIQPLTSGQIYLGAIPFVVIQLVMVGLVIAFPQQVTHYKSGQAVVDPATIKVDVPMPAAGATTYDAPAAPFGGAAPSFGAPASGTAPAPPKFGAGDPQAPGPAR